ncbi:MAG: type II secretion system F family protein [Proteobacteria bacterium]|nr:type II secretion system F family protein [Pseudomonadota bacterium]
MARYLYRAVGAGGTIQTGSAMAASPLLLRQTLHAQGLHLISAWRLGALASFFEASPSPQRKADFFTHLATLVGAGFPLEEAFSSFASDKALGRMGRQMATDLRAGKNLSEVFEAQRKAFDHTTLCVLTAAQKNASLTDGFTELARHWAWVSERRQDLTKALIYPSCLLILVTSLLTFLMDQVVPQLDSFLAMSGEAPSFSARLLKTLCAHALETVLGAITATALATATIVISARISSPMLLFWQKTLVRIPFFGPFWHDTKVHEMTHALGLMLAAKVDLLEALHDLELTASPFIARKIRACAALVRGGAPLAQSLGRVRLLSQVDAHLVALGERTGRLDHFVLQVAHLMGERMKKRTRRFLSLLEPGALLLVGALLIWIVSAIFLPLYEHLVLVEGL